MDDWEWLRTVLVVIVWVTVAGGALMATLWTAFGGTRAYGPEDELLADAGVAVGTDRGRVTSFSSAQVGIHGLLGITTAGLVTYAAARADDRTTGYWAALVAIAVTAIPGVVMYLKWHGGRRPGSARPARGEPTRVESRLPRPIVYGHGLAVLATVAALVVLLFVE